MEPTNADRCSRPCESRRWKHRSLVRKRIHALLCLAAILGSALCYGSPSQHPNHSADQIAANTEVPFDLYNDNLIIVKATVGPIKNANFILDTGTTPSAISKKVADRLGLIGTAAILETLNGTVHTESVVLPHIEIGSLHADSTKVLIPDLTFLERSLGISVGGIVGMDILSTTSFTIDYRKKIIILGPPAKCSNVVSFETRMPLITVKATLQGEEVRLIVDSGTGGLLIYRNGLRGEYEQIPLNPAASLSTIAGKTGLRNLRATVSLGKNDLGVRDLTIADVDSDPQNGFDGLLGFKQMGFRRVSFDFENGSFGWE